MTSTEFIRVAWSSILSNKLRSMLTLLGMIIGVFAIIASVTAVEVIDVYFNDKLNVLGSTTFTVTKDPAVQTGPMDERYRNRRNITYDHMLRLRRRAELPAAISPYAWFDMVRLRYEDNETEPNIFVLGSDEHWISNFGYSLEDGRFITAEDVQFKRPVIVLGATPTGKLFPNTNPIGKTVRIRGIRFKVIGTLEAKGNLFGQDQDNRIVAPITRMFDIFGGRDRDMAITVRSASVAMNAATMDEVTGHMRAIRKVPPLEENDFEVTTNNQILDTFENFTKYLTMGGAGIGFIALLAAGIGIMNIMLVTVTERTREIGLRKSVGATRGAVLRQFLLEAIVLCQIGGLIGIVLGAMVGNVTAYFFEIRAAFPWDWAIGGILGVTIIAVIFGTYPAWKAASLDPIEALRHE